MRNTLYSKLTGAGEMDSEGSGNWIWSLCYLYHNVSALGLFALVLGREPMVLLGALQASL